MAEQKAKRLANQSILLEKRKLEEEAAKRKIEEKYKLEELEQQKGLKYEEYLTKEIERIETQSEGESHSKFPAPFDVQVTIDDPSNNQLKPPVVKTTLANSDPLIQVLAKQNEISTMLLKTQEESCLPKCEPETFDGADLTKYRPFVQAFEATIETKCFDPSKRFFLLEKYTAGLAKQLVRGCRRNDPDLGYKEARRTLEREFGDENKIANAFLDRLNNWPNIKNEDRKAMQELNIYLKSCCNLMYDISSLNVLNSPSEIKKIVVKLPYKFRDRWRNRTLSVRNSNGSISFSDFSDFVQECFDLLDQPIFGSIDDPKAEKSTSEKPKYDSKKKSFSTKVVATKFEGKNREQTKSNAACPVCKKTNHKMINCIFFKEKSYEDRVKFIKDKKLCFGCFSAEHFSKDCKNRSKCETCEGKHPTLLHKHSEGKNEKPKGEDQAIAP